MFAFELDFAVKLTQAILSNKNWTIDKPPTGSPADMFVRDKATGRTTVIEIKDGKSYGELPISTLIPIFDLASKIVAGNLASSLILVSLSKIPSLMKERLEDINVKPMQQPTVEEVVAEIGHALAPAS